MHDKDDEVKGSEGNESQVIGTIKQQALIDYDISRLLLLMLSRCTRRAAREK